MTDAPPYRPPRLSRPETRRLRAVLVCTSDRDMNGRIGNIRAFYLCSIAGGAGNGKHVFGLWRRKSAAGAFGSPHNPAVLFCRRWPVPRLLVWFGRGAGQRRPLCHLRRSARPWRQRPCRRQYELDCHARICAPSSRHFPAARLLWRRAFGALARSRPSARRRPSGFRPRVGRCDYLVRARDGRAYGRCDPATRDRVRRCGNYRGAIAATYPTEPRQPLTERVLAAYVRSADGGFHWRGDPVRLGFGPIADIEARLAAAAPRSACR